MVLCKGWDSGIFRCWVLKAQYGPFRHKLPSASKTWASHEFHFHSAALHSGITCTSVSHKHSVGSDFPLTGNVTMNISLLQSSQIKKN